jgi:protein-histidine pros-kinase
MVDLYGPNNGFGWKMGETVGAQIISAPMSIVEKRARETGLVLIGGLTLVFLLVFVLTNLMLGRIVVRPVRRMSDLAEKVSMGDFSQPEYRKPGKDEISSLSHSFNRMRRSLERAMSMIDV